MQYLCSSFSGLNFSQTPLFLLYSVPWLHSQSLLIPLVKRWVAQEVEVSNYLFLSTVQSFSFFLIFYMCSLLISSLPWCGLSTNCPWVPSEWVVCGHSPLRGTQYLLLKLCLQLCPKSCFNFFSFINILGNI